MEAVVIGESQKIEFLVRFICESDAIEGIAYAPMLAKKHLKQRRARGHVGAILLLHELASKKKLLTEDVIKRVQFLIVSEQHLRGEREIAKKYRGSWRDCGVWIEERHDGKVVNKIPLTSPTEVPALMDTLIEETMRWQKACHKLSAVQKVAAIARFHYTYLHIHPFVDGNGRSGRALVYYLYRFCGLEPFVFTSADRSQTYYPCFKDPMAPMMMEEYFRNRTRLTPR